MRILVLLMLMSMLSVICAKGELRIWTGKNGQSFEAEYVKDASGKVWIRPPTGKIRIVRINALSKEDQNYIFKKTLPKLEAEVDDDISRSTVGTDIDNVASDIKHSLVIKKTSSKPYPVEYEVLFFVLGMDIRYKEYFLAEMKIDKFSLENKNDTYTFTGQELYFEYDPDPAWGTKYQGYALCVRTTEGIVLLMKGPDKFTKHIDLLKTGKVKVTRYKKDFTISTRYRR